MEDINKVYIIGAVVIITSHIKLEDWKQVETYMPEALWLMDDNGEPTFRVSCGEGMGLVMDCGIEWGTHTTENGCATVTLLLDEGIKDKVEAVNEIAGQALARLSKVEKRIPRVLEQLEGEDTIIPAACFIVI